MLRITKLADYAIVLVTNLAADRTRSIHTARGLSDLTRVPLPTVSKILKALARAGLLLSHRGVGGGFTLARPPAEVSVADVIQALEGPIAIMECLSEAPGACDIEGLCLVRVNWDRVNRAVRDALAGLSISDLASVRFPPRGAAPAAAGGEAARPVPTPEAS